ncbi:Lrp/AsnC family transcriptional regulator [Candidatus Woesearchaeota archaeon]|nr:Lrp/AsnC family transcriptional regulator [Candidatus Woesearchaeota archaeon]
MVSLDKFDVKLIQELEYDSSQSFSKIAKKLKTSQQVVSYRIRSLYERDIVYGFYTIINFSLLGYTSYRVMLRLTNITPKKQKQIINYLMKHSNVLWLVECGGRWDMIIDFIAKNIVQFNHFLRCFKNKFPKQIQNYDILTMIEIVYFGRDYFTKIVREVKKLPYFAGELKLIDVDRNDLEILLLISQKAMMSSLAIGREIGISPNTVILKKKHMQEEGLIQGFKPMIHLERISYSAYKALIKFQNITEQKEKELINYLRNEVNVIGIIRLIGGWDFEIEFEFQFQSELLQFTRLLRDKFREIIKEFEVIPLFHEYKYNFFPGDLLQNNSDCNS